MGRGAAVDQSKQESLLMTIKVRNSMVNHCKTEFPLEACGILSGKNGVIETIWRMKNVDHSPVSFSMSEKEIRTVFDLIEKKNEEVLAIYHSHPTAAAFPSHGDIAYNNYPELFHIIVSLIRASPEVKAYKIIGAKVKHLPIQLL